MPARRSRGARYAPAPANREPTTRSASPSSSGPRMSGSWAGSCCASPSTCIATSNPCSNAYRYPVWTAPPIPRLNGSRTTCALRAAATAAVPSTEPSSTTTISIPGSNVRSSSMTRPTLASSFSAGTIATRRNSARRATTESAGGDGAVARSATDAHGNGHADEVEDLPGAVRIRVLVEDAFARAATQLLGRGRIGEQLAVRRERLVGGGDDPELGARLEPALDPLDGVRDDRRARRRQLERPARGGGVDGGMRPPRHVQVDPRTRDRVREDVERDVAHEPRVADVPTEAAAAEGEIDLRVVAARLGNQRLHPLPPELVAVAVEEDVDVLLDLSRCEQLRVGAPENRLRATRAEVTQTLEPALGVRQHEVVLGWIGAVVVVEPRVHAAVLRQAHRHVPVVEDDRHVEALAEARRDPAQVRHRHGEDQHGGHVPLSLEDPLEMALPARRDVAPDRLAREPVADAVLGMLLGAAEQGVPAQASRETAGAGEELRLAVERVRRGPPPRRLDRLTAVGRDDQVGAGRVEPLPDLPPRGRAAVAEVEGGRRSDCEDLRRLHGAKYGDRVCRFSKPPVSRRRLRRRLEEVRASPAPPLQPAPLESSCCRPSVRSSPRQHRRDRLGEDRDVHPHRPVLEVVEVEPNEVVEGQVDAAGHLPEACHPG